MSGECPIYQAGRLVWDRIHPATRDIAQVQLYMYLLPKSNMAQWKGMDRKFEGAVVYADGHQVDIPADSVDEAFEARVADFMQKMTGPVLPRRVPSGPGCGFCELTRADCPERISAGVDAA